MKKNIVINFPKQEKFATSKLNWGLKKSIKKSAERSARSVKFAAEFTNTKQSSVGTNQDYIHLNSKFKPTSTKSERLIRTWYKLQAFSKI